MCFAQKKFNCAQSKKSLNGIVNKSGYPVILTERLPLKNREVQHEARQRGTKTVTKNCELQFLWSRKEGGVSFRSLHTKAELLKLKDVALPPWNISRVDNTRPGKRNNMCSIGPFGGK